MKILVAFLILLSIGCKSRVTTTAEDNDGDTVSISDNTQQPPLDTVETDSDKVYSNERFKDVMVTKTGDNTYTIKGKGQIFEANFNWVIEDGHDEIQKGYTMTDAGAPEWGNFSFTVIAPKSDPNTTLHIILFESSPKDGSRQYELPVLLY